jgi:hypothetical protein
MNLTTNEVDSWPFFRYNVQMTNRKLCILTCCVGMSWTTFAAAQDGANLSNDRERELQALREAEGGSTSDQILAERAAQKEAARQEMLRKEQEQQGTAPAATPTVPGAMPSSEDQRRALEALRQAEAAPLILDQVPPGAPAPAAPMTAPGQSQSVSAADKEAQLLEAQRQLQAAEEKARADQAQVEAARQQQELDQTRIQQAMDAEKAAAEQAQAAKARADEAAAEQAVIAAAQSHQSANQAPSAAPQKEAAASMQATTNSIASKEQRLADLLRLYQADQITPYQYHMERAKIISEP